MVATLQQLKDAVSDELRRANDATFQTRLTRLVAQAEQQIERDLRVKEREATTTVTTVAGTAIVAAPTNLWAVRSMGLPGYPALGQMSPEAYDAEFGASLELPRAFALTGGTFWFGPVPDGVYAYRCRYWKALPRLATEDGHAAFTAHWDVWFYATLLCAAPGLVDDERVMLWGKLYEGAIAGANQTFLDSGAASASPRRTYGRLS